MLAVKFVAPFKESEPTPPATHAIRRKIETCRPQDVCARSNAQKPRKFRAAREKRTLERMKVEIAIGDQKATFEADDEAALLRAVKNEAAKRAPWLMRAAVNAMSDLSFAAQVVARANKESGRDDHAPQSAREFLEWAISRGYATVL